MDLADCVAGSLVGLALGAGPAADRGVQPAPTAMARNLARSLTTRGGFDAGDLMSRQLVWFASAPGRVDSLTAQVLRRVSTGEDAARAARAVWERRGPEVSAGNGSVSWCGPLGLAYANRPGDLEVLAPAMSALTHADERCGTAVLAVTAAVAGLARALPVEEAVGSALALVGDRPGGEELEFLVEAIGRSRPIDGPDRGFCLYAAGAGLQAALTPGGTAAGLRHVQALGGDVGVNAAVAGARLGARGGILGLPEEQVRTLPDRDAIRSEADGLLPLARLGATA